MCPFALVGYKTGYSQLISNMCSWNDFWLDFMAKVNA